MNIFERYARERMREYRAGQIADLQYQLEMEVTNHPLHMLLTILTFGVWILIWIMAADRTRYNRKILRKKIHKLQQQERLALQRQPARDAKLGFIEPWSTGAQHQ